MCWYHLCSPSAGRHEVVKCWFDKALVLLQHTCHVTPPVLHISLNAARQPHVVICEGRHKSAAAKSCAHKFLWAQLQTLPVTALSAVDTSWRPTSTHDSNQSTESAVQIICAEQKGHSCCRFTKLAVLTCVHVDAHAALLPELRYVKHQDALKNNHLGRINLKHHSSTKPHHALPAYIYV